MEQLVLLLIIGAISLINWLIEQSGKRREQRRFEAERARREAEANPYLEANPEPTSVPEVPEKRPQKEIRELLEVFGIPLPDQLPLPVPRQEMPTPAPKPATSVATPVKIFSETRPVMVKRKASPSTVRKAPVDITSQTALRQAVVWREILGPPRSLQPY